jgi:hypothetical protein
MMGFFYFTTQFLQGVLGFTPLQAGLAFLPMTAVNFAVAMAIPQVTRRVGQAIPLVLGIALTLAGTLWLSRIDLDSSYLTGVALPMVLIGAGQGFTFAPLTAAGIAGTTAAEAGAASGAVNTFHQVGSSLGLGVLVSLAALTPGNPSSRAVITAQASTALTGGSGFLLLALLVAVALIVPGIRARSRTEWTAQTRVEYKAATTGRIATMKES